MDKMHQHFNNTQKKWNWKSNKIDITTVADLVVPNLVRSGSARKTIGRNL